MSLSGGAKATPVEEDAFSIPLTLPSALSGAKSSIFADFKAEGIVVTDDGYYPANAAGPPPEVSFWIDLARHAGEYALQHAIELLEGALGLAALRALGRVRKWLRSNPRLHLLLPTTKGQTRYVIPEEPEAAAALKSIGKHYRSLSDDASEEYYWVDGGWRSGAG